jgi:carbamoyltransferase
VSAPALSAALHAVPKQATGPIPAQDVVIGIHDGHNASVAVVKDGVVTLAIQEERFTRVKNQGDLPQNALETALGLASERASAVPIALNGLYMNYGQWQRERIVAEYERSSSLASRLKQPLKNTFVDRLYRGRKSAERAERLAAAGFNRSSLVPIEHHLAHASAAFYTCPWQDEKVLVMTCDGSGDRLSATVNIGHRGGLTRLAEVSEHDSIGRLYALVTRHLGMVPLEHEYKVMGLAPYVSDGSKTEAAARIFSDLFEFPGNSLTWRRRAGVPSMYAAREPLRRALDGQRFDVIAAGAQRFIEYMLTTWVRNAIRETGIRKVACSGGVFMNVKANLALLEIEQLEDLYVFPSCGDESNSIGAALYAARQRGHSTQPLGPIYFGDPITDREAQLALEPAARASRLRMHFVDDIERRVAEKLSEGKIVARAKGAAEFGARALGNRSILARADSPHAIRAINEMIKCRDFWMPFAPSVLEERAGEYYIKPKPVRSPYMMFAFHSRPEKRAAFTAAQHPYDYTARPHEVRREHNPDYHRLLIEYEHCTGEGILLNTSFNLHGEPVVQRASDAVDVFLRSGLEYMALANWWVEKRL